MIRIALIVALLLGCKIKNELSCEDPANADLPHCNGVDAPETCTVPGPCRGGGVCNVDDGICVECVENTDCPAAEPVCNTSNLCELCDAHADCASTLCDLATGACIDATDVAYVSTSGLGTTADGCPQDNPCPTINDAVDTPVAAKPFIKIAAGTYTSSGETDIDRSAKIFADPGVKLTRSDTGPVLKVSSAAIVEISNLEVFGATGANGHGIELQDNLTELVLDSVLIRMNSTRGVISSNQLAAKITMRRCIVTQNLGGGVNLQGLGVDITNTLIVRNGNTGANTGGATLDPSSNPIFEFNTIADNASLAAATSGVNCVNAFAAANNIVTNNGLGATCTFEFSLFTTVVPLGTGNRAGEPMFVETDPANATTSTFYRIQTGSVAIDMADMAATQAVDIDGQSRPNGTVRDMGADELNP